MRSTVLLLVVGVLTATLALAQAAPQNEKTAPLPKQPQKPAPGALKS
jgi:hypothetical protein